jgi:hypothetical protein
MNTSWKSGIVALVGLAAITWLGLHRDGNAHSLQTRAHPAVECNSRDPLSHCAAEVYFGYPIGDGLVITLMEDFL